MCPWELVYQAGSHIPAHRALPGTPVAVHLEVGLQVEALDVLAPRSSGWYVDAAVCDGTLESDVG